MAEGLADLALYAVLVAAVWRQVGYIMVLYLAGLKACNESLEEAAAVDGANAWTRFWRIVMPQLKGVHTVVFAVTVIEDGCRGVELSPGDSAAAIEAMRAAGLEAVVLEAKEGLALLNGTTLMVGYGALMVRRAINLILAADIAASLSLEALHGTDRAYDARVHAVRPHPRQIDDAAFLRKILESSQFLRPPQSQNVQDPYTLRCVPQVHGAVRDAPVVHPQYPPVQQQLRGGRQRPVQLETQPSEQDFGDLESALRQEVRRRQHARERWNGFQSRGFVGVGQFLDVVRRTAEADTERVQHSVPVGVTDRLVVDCRRQQCFVF